MQMLEGFSNWLKQTAAGAALLPAVASSTQAQPPNPAVPPEEMQGDIYRDLRAFPDKIENKEYPWKTIQERKLDLNSEKNKKFIDKLKKLYEKSNKEYDNQEISNLILKIIDLDLNFDTKSKLSKQARNLLVPFDSKSKQKIIWQMADLAIEKTKK
jgi:thymidylate synthase ThyX